jgi:ribonuclease Z
VRGKLPVHGPPDAIDTVRRAFGAWDTSGWTDMPEVAWQAVPPEQGVLIATGADFELRAAPGVHGGNQVIALRALAFDGGGTVAYSADGEPSPAVQMLAQGADILVHEATGPWAGHSTAEGAARLGQAANVRRLVLVHLAPNKVDLALAKAAAEDILQKPVAIGEDLQRFRF